MKTRETIFFEKPYHYINRELSWLDFNSRVQDEAANPDNPLFERMKFLSIVSTNLDEFFMVRVASLRDQVNAGYKGVDPSGLRPRKQLELLTEKIRLQMDKSYLICNEQIMPELRNNGIFFIRKEEVTERQSAYLDELFESQIYPVLTPMAVDGSRHFPLLLNKSLNIAVLLEGKEEGEIDFATVQVPAMLPRAVEVPSDKAGVHTFMMLEEIISRYLYRLFAGRRILSHQEYRITRNADLTIEEEEAADLLKEIEKSLRKRKWGAVIRLEVPVRCDARILKTLEKALEVTEDEVYFIDGALNLDFFMKRLYSIEGYDEMRYAPFTAALPKELENGEDIFAAIKKKDIFFYHPYESFDPIVRFVQQAASDPDVLAIKQTLYRVSGHSPIVAALAQAAEAGKQVTVLLEIKARFDEENNIQWGKCLEQAGCHVVYGLVGLKTHSKITLVVRRENGGIQRYIHLATGNYNDVTAKIYTDMGILSANHDLGEDGGNFFNMLTGYCDTPDMKRLIYAPHQLRDGVLRFIRRETENARKGLKASIDAKMNSLVDEEVIAALYEASRAGVKIRLMIRGICCLRPHVPDLSENIEVRSIVGRFLEHARIFYFENNGDSQLFLSSADWMNRNLDRRVELMFPVLDADIREKVLSILNLQFRDNAKAWHMFEDGHYERIPIADGEEKLNSQEYLAALASKTAEEQ